MTTKVWNLKYFAGNTGRQFSDASNPQRRTEVLEAARQVASFGWRAWIEHASTGRRIFESDAERIQREAEANRRIVQFAADNEPGLVPLQH